MNKISEKDFKITFQNDETRIFYNNGNVIAELHGYVRCPRFNDGWPVDELTNGFYVTGKGVARVMIDDEYSDEVGKKIALAKAENKCYEAARRRITKRMEELLEFNNAVLRFCDKTNGVTEHNLDYIKRIGK